MTFFINEEDKIPNLEIRRRIEPLLTGLEGGKVLANPPTPEIIGEIDSCLPWRRSSLPLASTHGGRIDAEEKLGVPGEISCAGLRALKSRGSSETFVRGR